jgi:hypothetical protein
MAKSKTPNENEIEKALAKADEHDAAGTVTSTKDLGKLMNPEEVSGNVHGRGPGKGKKSK